MRFNRNGLLSLLILWGATFVYRQFQGGFVSNFLFYAITSLSLLEIWIWMGTRGKVVVERRLSKKQLKDGERLDVDLFLSFHEGLAGRKGTLISRNKIDPSEYGKKKQGK